MLKSITLKAKSVSAQVCCGWIVNNSLKVPATWCIKPILNFNNFGLFLLLVYQFFKLPPTILSSRITESWFYRAFYKSLIFNISTAAFLFYLNLANRITKNGCITKNYYNFLYKVSCIIHNFFYIFKGFFLPWALKN